MEAKTAEVNGRTFSLTPREYAILELMLLSPRKVFTKANRFESIWNEDYIETIWGMGYRLIT